jgi:YesN/AraC family two-component response regulator
MVSKRCILAVTMALKKFNFHSVTVNLGEVEFSEDISAGKRELLREILHESGLELMDNKSAILIERIKNTIIAMIYSADEMVRMNFSSYLSEKLNHNYTYMANLFSEVQGNTIEQFIISHRVERAKELISYNELNMTEIAWKLNYSSVAHLSNQFKKVTGLSPSNFKLQHEKKRVTIDELGRLMKVIV